MASAQPTPAALTVAKDAAQSPLPGRRPDGTFAPGFSGNPTGGVPKWVREVRESAGSHTPTALARLVTLLDSKNEAIVLEAAKAVLGFAGVKPVALDGEILEVRNAGTDSVAVLAALLARRASSGGAGSAPGDPAAAGS